MANVESIVFFWGVFKLKFGFLQNSYLAMWFVLESSMSLGCFCASHCSIHHWLCNVISKLPMSFSCFCASHHLNIYFFCRQIIVTMLGVMLSTSGPNDCIKKIVKKEGESSLSLNVRGFTSPLYAKVPELFSDDGTCNFSRKDFVEKYDLC